MKTVEFYAGSRSFSKAAHAYGARTFCVDWNPYPGIDLVSDVAQVGFDDLPYIPDVLWASPECTTYSVAALRVHRDGIKPKSDYAEQCDDINTKFFAFIRDILAVNKDMVYFIENPRGMLRNMPFMLEFLEKTGGVRRTVWYCQYGYKFAKPTDIFTNCTTWTPRPVCRNGNPACTHSRSPRGSSGGVQGLPSGTINRSHIPRALCYEIVEHLINIRA